MKKLILLISLVITGLYSNAQEENCSGQSENWKSEKKVLAGIENINFNTNETLQPDGKSWMISANFYSCDDQYGYLVVKSDNKTFVHHNVPISVWRSLKEAKSIGGFYNFYIKDYYKFGKNSTTSLML